jgi:hypothetical protein
MKRALNSARLESSAPRGTRELQQDVSPIAAIEPLESRRLLSASGITLQETAGAAFTANLGNLTTVAPGTNLTATINWGDGKTSKGVLVADNTVGLDEINFEVDGTHTYKHAGTFKITARVTQPGVKTSAPKHLVASFSDKAIVPKVAAKSLNGTLAIDYTLAPPMADVGASYDLTGTGSAGTLGAVTITGSVSLPGFIANGSASGTLTLTSDNPSAAGGGSVTLDVTGPKGGSGFPSKLTYTISGGTGAFATATGTGSIAVTLGATSNSYQFVITSKVTVV